MSVTMFQRFVSDGRVIEEETETGPGPFVRGELEEGPVGLRPMQLSSGAAEEVREAQQGRGSHPRFQPRPIPLAGDREPAGSR